MKKQTLFVILFLIESFVSNSQQTDISIYYGRFWSPYKYNDKGIGFLNQASSNYNFFPGTTFNRYYSKKISLEYGMFFTLYEQYYSTRKYIPAFESTYGAGHAVVRFGYSFVSNNKFESRVKGGFGLGIAPDLYESEYIEMLVYPIVDSITRGVIKRNFTSVFPMLSTGFDISFKVTKRFNLSLAANYQKGFIKISEYDIYYNDGSGNNDQRAKQWGKGDFYGIQFGLRYMLKDENGNRFDSKRNK